MYGLSAATGEHACLAHSADKRIRRLFVKSVVIEDGRHFEVT